MKIAVVGTSNSIRLDGYFPMYQAIEYPNSVDNLSLGGSNCQLIPYSIEKYKIFDNYDFLITDCAVNDGDYLSNALRTPDWLYNELYSIMSMIKEAPIQHVHLVFPYDIAYKEHYSIHCQVCQELEIPYIDIEKILITSSQLGQKELFFDKQHISYFLSKQLAYLIKEKRKNLFSKPAIKNTSSCYKSKKYIFYSLPEKFKTAFPLCTKASSLLTNDFILLKNSDTLFLDDLPAMNLESIFFWTNTKAGYFSLASETYAQNYNLFYQENQYMYFRPIPYRPFPVNKFLKLQVGLDPNYPVSPPEFTMAPLYTDNNELILNSFLFSQPLNPPLSWKEKKPPDTSEQYIAAFQRIYAFMTTVPQLTNNEKLKYVSADYIYIAAHLYPHNQILRREFLKRIKKADNPYFLYAYVKLYVLPRKKYSMAVKLLKHVLAQTIIPPAVADLVYCCIQLKQYEEALKTVQLISEGRYTIKYLQLLCTLYARMNVPDLFFKTAQKILALNEGYSYLLDLVDDCIVMKKYGEALQFLQILFEDTRNFAYKQRYDSMMKKMEEIQAEIKNQE